MANPDDDLVARAKAGDPDAWRELHRSLAGRLLVWLRTLPTGDTASAADDLAAEAWLTAASRIHDFTGDSAQFGGWLFGIARHHALNARRKAARRRTWPTELDESLTPPMAAADESAEHEDYVRRLLAGLPRREAEVVACLEVVGLDVAATGLALGMTANAVRVTRHRALSRLRRANAYAGRISPASSASAAR